MAKKSAESKPDEKRAHPTEVVPLASLKPHPRNYKKHPAEQLNHLCASLKQYGQFRNVVVARDSTILAGHGVVLAMAKLGWEEATVVRLDLDPASPKALKLVALDNELPKFAETDDRALAELLRDVAGADEPDVLLGTGYDDASLSALLAEHSPPEATSDPARVVEVSPLRAPFPWFGGKSRAAPIVWGAFGEVDNYVEPFAGSLAVLLARPGGASGVETVNDLDAWIANFWRSVAHDAETVAGYSDWPVNESDLHARHGWLLKQEEWRRKMRDPDLPDFFDAKVAGWWVWGCCLWIGSGWCDERLMRAQVRDPHLSKIPHLSTSGMDPHAAPAPSAKIPFLGHGGRRVHRPAPSEQIPFLGHAGRGEHRALASEQLPPIDGKGRGSRGEHRESLNGGSCAATRENLLAAFAALRDRTRRVRVACGSWERVLTEAVTTGHGVTGVLLDPPYAEGTDNLYGNHDKAVSAHVRRWAIDNGGNPDLRIAFCGYDGEHEAFPDGWRCVSWKAQGGYGSGNGNPYRERIWLSPACLRPKEGSK